jgi:hypothetical protein
LRRTLVRSVILLGLLLFIKRFSSLIVFTILAAATSCKRYSLIGSWRRIDLIDSFKTSNTEFRPGDLKISADSTYIFYGVPCVDTSTTSGWLSCGDIKGTWSMPDKSNVMFKIDPQINFGIVYKIITLDEKHLIIVYPHDNDSLFTRFVRF